MIGARDAAMYNHFRWLAARLPRHAKIIVWTATVHAAKDATAAGMYKTGPNFGALLHRDYGDRAFVLDFRVPVNAKGWVWSSELETARAISDSGRVEDAFNWFRNYRTPTSASPIAAIHDAA